MAHTRCCGARGPQWLTTSLRGNVVGDLRVSFDVIPQQQTVTIIAEHRNGTLHPHVMSHGLTFLMLEPGVHTVDDGFDALHDRTTTWAWTLRAVALVVMYCGFRCLGPLTSFTHAVAELGHGVSCHDLFWPKACTESRGKRCDDKCTEGCHSFDCCCKDSCMVGIHFVVDLWFCGRCC